MEPTYVRPYLQKTHPRQTTLHAVENTPVPLRAPRRIVRDTIAHTASNRHPDPRIPESNPILQFQLESDPVAPGGSARPHLYVEIKEHAPFMVGLSGVLGGVALAAVCSDKTKGHPQICYALSALRIYSLVLNLAALTTLAMLLLFIPHNAGNTLTFRYLWLLWVGIVVLSTFLTFSQVLLFSWPEGVQLGVLILVAALCIVAGVIFCLECYARSRALASTESDVEQG